MPWFEGFEGIADPDVPTVLCNLSSLSSPHNNGLLDRDPIRTQLLYCINNWDGGVYHIAVLPEGMPFPPHLHDQNWSWSGEGFTLVSNNGNPYLGVPHPVDDGVLDEEWQPQCVLLEICSELATGIMDTVLGEIRSMKTGIRIFLYGPWQDLDDSPPIFSFDALAGVSLVVIPQPKTILWKVDFATLRSTDKIDELDHFKIISTHPWEERMHPFYPADMRQRAVELLCPLYLVHRHFVIYGGMSPNQLASCILPFVLTKEFCEESEEDEGHVEGAQPPEGAEEV